MKTQQIIKDILLIFCIFFISCFIIYLIDYEIDKFTLYKNFVIYHT